jgi:hypothetical protein
MTGQLCEFELFLSSKCFEAPEAGPEAPQPESREDGMLSILILEWFVILLGQSRDSIAGTARYSLRAGSQTARETYAKEQDTFEERFSLFSPLPRES